MWISGEYRVRHYGTLSDDFLEKPMNYPRVIRTVNTLFFVAYLDSNLFLTR